MMSIEMSFGEGLCDGSAEVKGQSMMIGMSFIYSSCLVLLVCNVRKLQLIREIASTCREGRTLALRFLTVESLIMPATARPDRPAKSKGKGKQASTSKSNPRQEKKRRDRQELEQLQDAVDTFVGEDVQEFSDLPLSSATLEGLK